MSPLNNNIEANDRSGRGLPCAVSLLTGVVACLLFITAMGWGQGVTGQLLGTVEDTSRAAIPHAQVTVTNQSTGVAHKYTTNSYGDYTASFLPPGTYQVRVVAPGFQIAVSPDNVVTVNGTTRVDMVMEVGALAQAVQVHAVAPLIQSTTSSMGDALDVRAVENLPLNGRVVSQLVQTTPGAIATGAGNAPESASGVGTFGPITASVNGMPWQGTNVTIDGVSNMELENAFINVSPPVDAVQEVRVSTNNSSADVGVYGGAQVNEYLKSGTNEFHGSVFEYFRNDSLDARAWQAVSKAPFKGNQFGATFGGPIKKNRIFFFADYQGNRIRNGISYNFTVPTAAMRNGDFDPTLFGTIYDPKTGHPFPNNAVPTNRFDPVAAKMVAGTNIWPNPTEPNSILDNYQQNTSESDDVNSFDVKGDYNRANGDHLFARESYQRRDLVAPSPGTQFILIGDVNSSPRDHNADVGYTHSFSPNILNDFRLGFNRFFTLDFGNDFRTNENTALGIPNGNLAQFPGSSGIANFRIGDIMQTGSQAWTDAHRITTAYELADNLTWIKSKHNLEFGTDIRRIEASVTNADNNQSGQLGFSQDFTSSCTNQPNCKNPTGGYPFASFLLGLPNNDNRGFVNTDPNNLLLIMNVYGQDNYRVTQSLTLNLALRWDLITPAIEAFNRQSNFNLQTGLLNAASPSNRGPNVNTNYHDFAPRVGFAYSPDHGKTAVRGAFGISYFPDHYGAEGGTLERNYPLFEQFSIAQQQNFVPFAALSSTANCVASCFVGLPGFVPAVLTPTIAPPPNVNVYLVPPNYSPDTAYMWNFGIDRQLTKSTALDVAYVGTKGTHLFRSFNIDVAIPGPGALNPRRFYSAVAPNTTSPHFSLKN